MDRVGRGSTELVGPGSDMVSWPAGVETAVPLSQKTCPQLAFRLVQNGALSSWSLWGGVASTVMEARVTIASVQASPIGKVLSPT